MTAGLEWALLPLGYEYMRNAIAGAAIVGAVCAFLSCFVILRRWSLLGDALSHAVVPGVAVAAVAGVPLLLGALIAAGLAVAGIGFVERQTVLKGDAAIGIVFTSFFALGLLLVSLQPSGLRVETILFGNLLGIAPGDLWQIGTVALLAFLLVGAVWKDLLFAAFDPVGARAIALNTRGLHVLLLGTLALVCVAALQTVGALLVAAMLITPGATAYLLTARFGRMLVIAPLLGASVAALGAYASFFLEGATGGCIVLAQTLLFLLVWLGGLVRSGLRGGAGRREVAA